MEIKAQGYLGVAIDGIELHEQQELVLPAATLQDRSASRRAGVLTGPDGHYHFPNLQRGGYDLVVEKRGYFRDVWTPVVVQAGFDAVYLPVELEKCGSPNCRTNRKSRLRGPCE